jgi:hypothetical protein
MNLHKCLAEMKPVRQLSNCWWQRQTGIINSRLVHSMKGLLQSLMWVNVKWFSFKQESWKWNTAYKNMRKTKTMLIKSKQIYIHFYSNSTNQGRLLHFSDNSLYGYKKRKQISGCFYECTNTASLTITCQSSENTSNSDLKSEAVSLSRSNSMKILNIYYSY